MACFTRPELKVERVSYDVITPSAARAIFEAMETRYTLASNQNRSTKSYKVDIDKEK